MINDESLIEWQSGIHKRETDDEKRAFEFQCAYMYTNFSDDDAFLGHFDRKSQKSPSTRASICLFLTMLTDPLLSLFHFTSFLKIILAILVDLHRLANL